MTRWLLLLCLAFTLHAQVKINEVLFYNDTSNPDPNASTQWLELFNTGTDPVDLTGWSVTASDGINGASPRALPSILLPGGAYLVVHFASGVNNLDFLTNSGDYFTGDDSANTPYWSIDADEAALYSPDSIVDFINWAGSTVVYIPGSAHNDAVAAGIWTQGAVLLHDAVGSDKFDMLRMVAPGDSIGRDPFSTDTDSVADFGPLGGPSSLVPTPGQQNLAVAPITPPPANSQQEETPRPRGSAPVPQRKKWTIMLYMSGDNNLEGAFIQKICRLQQAGGSTADVTFLVMLDLKNIPDPVSHVSTTYRGVLPAPSGAVDCRAAPSFTLDGPGSADIGEQDMGDPATLSGFISWGQQLAPADNFGLIISSHGDGWKSVGPDETYSQGSREHVDYLYMGELSTALSGQFFDWIAFDACLMGSIEVAHQLKPFASFLLASEEVTSTLDFPYESMAQHIAANPTWIARTFITDIFTEYKARVSASPVPLIRQKYTVSVIDLAEISDLSASVLNWSKLLAPGMSLFQGRDDPTDNVQIITKNQRDAAETFFDKNYIDFYDFTQKMRDAKPALPACLLTPVPLILSNISAAVIAEAHGPGHPNAHGMHIYFPQRRMIRVHVDSVGDDEILHKDPATGLLPPPPGDYPDFFNQPYDLPYSRQFNGSTSFVHYGTNRDQLPLRSRDPETGEDFGPSIVWPLPQSPGLLFPNDTLWKDVLDSFYHPDADSHILSVTVNGVTYTATPTGGAPCVNPVDSITVPLGTTVTISGRGSSDADMPTGLTPLHWFWDLNDKVGCTANCISPYEVTPPGVDPAVATTNMDADIDRTLTTIDQHDADSQTITRVCDAPQITVTQMDWDDDATPGMPFHNTRKSAAYVHTQTGRHQAILNCTSPPPSNTLYPMSGTMNLTFTVISDPFDSASFVNLTSGMVDFTSPPPPPGTPSGSNAPRASTPVTITLTGNQPALPNGTGTYDTSTGIWNATILSTGRIAGFQNVEVKWVGMQFGGANNNSVTGTYEVGTNGNLNGESSPVTYRVTGTVTRK